MTADIAERQLQLVIYGCVFAPLSVGIHGGKLREPQRNALFAARKCFYALETNLEHAGRNAGECSGERESILHANTVAKHSRLADLEAESSAHSSVHVRPTGDRSLAYAEDAANNLLGHRRSLKDREMSFAIKNASGNSTEDQIVRHGAEGIDIGGARTGPRPVMLPVSEMERIAKSAV